MMTHRTRVPFLTIAVAAITGLSAPLRAQELPALSLAMKGSWQPPNEYLAEGQIAPLMGFLQFEVQASAAAAGTWCIPILDVFCKPADFGENVPTWASALEVDTCTVSDLLTSNVSWVGSCLTETITDRDDDGSRVDQAIVGGWMYPLFNPGNQTIAQVYGTTPAEHWEANSDGTWFSMNALLEYAAWERLKDEPEFVGVTAESFFNNRGYARLLEADPTLTILMLGMRAPGVDPYSVPGPGGTVQGLGQYPNPVPNITVAPQRTITYVGTGLGNSLQFWPQTAGPLYPIHMVAPGGSVDLPAAGFRPRMQVALEAPGGSPRFEVSLVWCRYGAVRIAVPVGTEPGAYDVVQYRNPVSSVVGSPWTPWMPLAAGYRPRLLVQ
jgi:hypothetical protein